MPKVCFHRDAIHNRSNIATTMILGATLPQYERNIKASGASLTTNSLVLSAVSSEQYYYNHYENKQNKHELNSSTAMMVAVGRYLIAQLLADHSTSAQTAERRSLSCSTGVNALAISAFPQLV